MIIINKRRFVFDRDSSDSETKIYDYVRAFVML